MEDLESRIAKALSVAYGRYEDVGICPKDIEAAQLVMDIMWDVTKSSLPIVKSTRFTNCWEPANERDISVFKHCTGGSIAIKASSLDDAISVFNMHNIIPSFDEDEETN